MAMAETPPLEPSTTTLFIVTSKALLISRKQTVDDPAPVIATLVKLAEPCDVTRTMLVNALMLAPKVLDGGAIVTNETSDRVKRSSLETEDA